MSHTHAIHTRTQRKLEQHATHASTLPTLARYLGHPRHPHKHATHATHASMNSTPFLKLVQKQPPDGSVPQKKAVLKNFAIFTGAFL